MSAPKRQGGLRSRSRTDNRAQSASSAAVQLDPQLSDQEESIEQQHEHQQSDILPQQSQQKSNLLSQQQQQSATLKAASATGGRGGGLRSGARARQNTKSALSQAAASASQSEVVNDESILFKDDEDNEGEDDDSNGNDDNNANIKARQAASAAGNMSLYDAASVSVDAPRIKMMVATDSHLGFLERDPVRGNDSFVSFEEMLQLAVENNVDMVLLGGDLFHENRPSRKTLHRTMEILRKYTMGDRPCNLRHLSDAKRNYGDGVMSVNYMDPNINISLPVFTIHGNHDDPTGDGRLSAVDLLASTRMINYFGQYRSIDDITVAPVLLEKRRGGTEHLINSELTSEDYTRLAIFGLGNVRDERLNRTFLRKRVRVLWPAEDTKSWFNLFVIHQNRAAHGPTSYIPESFLPPLLDMVLWGHEHECRVVPEQNPERLFYVTQPGSSVATALSEGEAVRKHVAIVEICGAPSDISSIERAIQSGNRQSLTEIGIHSDAKLHIKGSGIDRKAFTFRKLPLRTVRPFVIEDIILSEIKDLIPGDDVAVSRALAQRVHTMIKRAKVEFAEERDLLLEDLIDEHAPSSSKVTRSSKRGIDDAMETDAHFDEDEMMDDSVDIGASRSKMNDSRIFPRPLVRLRVEYSGGFSVISPHGFGQQFVDLVANPKELLNFYRRRPGQTLRDIDGDPHANCNHQHGDNNNNSGNTVDKLVGSGLADMDISDNFNFNNNPSNVVSGAAAASGAGDPEGAYLEADHVDKLVMDYLKSHSGLQVLSAPKLSSALREFVEKDDKDAINDFVKSSLYETQNRIVTGDGASRFLAEEMNAAAKARMSRLGNGDDDDDGDEDDGDGGEEVALATRSTRGRGARGRGTTRGRGAASTRGKTATRGGRGGRATAAASRSALDDEMSEDDDSSQDDDDDDDDHNNDNDDDDDDDDNDDEDDMPTRGRGAAAKKRKTASGTAAAPTTSRKGRAAATKKSAIGPLALTPASRQDNGEDDDDDGFQDRGAAGAAPVSRLGMLRSSALGQRSQPTSRPSRAR